MARPVVIGFDAEVDRALAGIDRIDSSLDDAGNVATKAGGKIDGALDSTAEHADTVASKGAQAAGALSGLGELIGGPFGAGMQAGGIAMQAAADAGDLLNVVTDSAIVRKAKDVVSTAAQTVATTAQTAATKAAAIGQRVLNAAMRANPIGLVITALTLLVAGVVLAYKRSATFRSIVTGALNAVRAAAGAVANAFRGVVTAVGQLLSGVRSRVGAVVSYVGDVPGKIKRGLGSVGTMLYGAGRDVISGLINGIKAMAGRAIDAAKGVVKGAVNGAKKLLGINSPSRVFRLIGQQTMEGLEDGIDGRRRSVLSTVNKLVRDVAKTPVTLELTDAKGKATVAPAGAYGEVSRLVHIDKIVVQLEAGMSQAEMGREYRKAIRAAEELGI